MKTSTWISIGIGGGIVAAVLIWGKLEADRKADAAANKELQLTAVIENLAAQGVEVTEEDVEAIATEIDRRGRLGADPTRTVYVASTEKPGIHNVGVRR